MEDAGKIKSLEERVALLEKLVQKLAQENKLLKKENASLKERLGLNSTNSSIPPSKDWKKQKNPRKQ